MSANARVTELLDQLSSTDANKLEIVSDLSDLIRSDEQLRQAGTLMIQL
jgi:hypothetical protein